jgi:hypothetical protein
MRFLTHREDQYDVTVRSRPRVFRLYSTDGTSGGYYMSPHKKFLLFSFTFYCIGVHALSLIGCLQLKYPPFSFPVHACACFITIFIVYFLVISRRIILVSSV